MIEGFSLNRCNIYGVHSWCLCLVHTVVCESVIRCLKEKIETYCVAKGCGRSRKNCYYSGGLIIPLCTFNLLIPYIFMPSFILYARLNWLCFWFCCEHRLKALISIPKVQPRFALSISKKYPTMKSLLSVYMDPSKSVCIGTTFYFQLFLSHRCNSMICRPM